MRLEPLVRQLWIVDKDFNTIPLRPKVAQQRWLAIADAQLAKTGRIRTLTLKARQVGYSTITGAVAYSLCFVKPNSSALAITHENDASEHLLSMAHTFHETGPFEGLYKLKHRSANHLAWVENRSSMKIATAGNKGAGRSKTLNILHASEVAHWPAPTITWGGLRQAVPQRPLTMIALESTANGVGDFFHREWLRASDPNSGSEYAPVFVPWWEDPGYRASVIGISSVIGKRTEYERTIAQAFKLDDDQLAWLRYCHLELCNGDEGLRMQEYPTEPEEAFQASGNNVFSEPKLREVYKPLARFAQGRLDRDGDKVTFVPDPRGPLKLFKRPGDRDAVYQIGGDPAKVPGRGDFACAQVINRRTLEQVAVFRQRIDGEDFGQELFKLGLFFNTATIAPEVFGAGAITTGWLRAMRYPKVWKTKRFARTQGKSHTYGWVTSDDTKRAAIERTRSYVHNGQTMGIGLVIHDPHTFSEMRNYVQLPDGRFGNANGEPNDDTVMALAIALTTHYLDPLPDVIGANSDPFGEEPDDSEPYTPDTI